MPIRWDARNKRWRYSFNRVIAGKRHRASRLLPKGWSQAQADAYDRKESGRLYAVATGVQAAGDELIDRAVLLYLSDKAHLKSHKAAQEHLAAIAWAYAGKPLSALPDVAREVTQNPESAREGKTLMPATLRNRLALLKAACRWAWKQHGLGDKDPTARMQLPAVRNERHVYIDRREMLAVARACTDHATRIAVRVSFYSGLRLGEILRTEVIGDALVLADTKNDDRRAIPAHPRIATCLDYLPLAVADTHIQYAFARARERVGLEHVHFHDLRHSAASEMVNAGVDLYSIGKVLGHRDPRSTQRYAHLQHQTMADAIGKIGSRKDAHNGKPKAA